ncbi:MAG TPA: hypothetical protein VJX72_08930 [Candidatus Acidoferrum sp.]|jgi:hypothetical protein|nr:hypothetical protein [Candidatus Acidoferrum sp.]
MQLVTKWAKKGNGTGQYWNLTEAVLAAGDLDGDGWADVVAARSSAL